MASAASRAPSVKAGGRAEPVAILTATLERVTGLRILQLLAQRPGLTGSGATLEALTRELEGLGHRVHAVVGVPAADAPPRIAELPAERIHPLRFGPGGDLPFPVPGMSDVMPYESTVFASMDEDQWASYREAWRHHLARVVADVRPDVIHSHHVWLLSALVKDVAPDTPQLVHCHATGLRQLQLCPRRAEEVIRGVRRADAFATLQQEHDDRLTRELEIPEHRIHRVGAGYDQRVFHDRGRAPSKGSVTYAGKIALAKGLAPLLDAFEQLRAKHPSAHLFVAGGGAGAESDALRARIDAAPWATKLGHLTPDQLAAQLRTTEVFVLPSFYEGLPLVLAEARACGCRLVATALPSIQQLAAAFGDALRLVDPPERIDVDRPAPTSHWTFVRRLQQALDDSLSRPAAPPPDPVSGPPDWTRVAKRIAGLHANLLREGPQRGQATV